MRYFRENIKGNTPIGKEAKSFIDSGRLVPDSVVIDMVKDRIAQDDVKKDGFMLDGFPRTLDQAKSLSDIAKLDIVVVIDIRKKILKSVFLVAGVAQKAVKYIIFTKLNWHQK